MIILNYPRATVATAVAVLAASVALVAQEPSNIVSLKVAPESAPAGEIAQMKVRITEPKPITTGGGRFGSGFSRIEGIALTSPARDVAGAAVVHGGDVVINMVSPSGTFGMEPDYPALTIAGRVPNASLGTRFPMTIDAGALRLFDASGTLYPVEAKQGTLTVGSGLSVGNVVPGSANLPAGAVVSIFGTGFQPRTHVRFKEIELAQVRYVSARRIDVVLAQPAHMHGVAVRVKNPDGQEVFYFSYQRTTRVGTTVDPVLAATYPIFPTSTTRAATVRLPSGSSGLAVQNPGAISTTVFAELLTASGQPLAAGVLSVPGDSYVVRRASEVFGFTHAGAVLVRLRAVDPVQALGIELTSAGSALPILPQ